MKLFKILLVVLAILSIQSCNKEIDGYSESQGSYVYFNLPFKQDIYGRNTTERVDSLMYSFALDDISVTSYTFKIPVSTVGFTHSNDRTYKVEIISDTTNATSAEWDANSINNAVIHSGRLEDTLYVTVNRTADMKTSWKKIGLKILSNDNFIQGQEKLLTVKLSFSDILTAPSWWTKWLAVFGPFSREKYVKWQEIYYLGADPNVETIGGPNKGQQLYWGNMPYYTYSSYYPSTFVFIRILKNYFIENEVYPDGDTTQPRISIP